MTLYDEYALIESRIKELESKKNTLRFTILKDMIEKGEDAIESAVGKFSITRLKKWEYPAKVLELGEKFKTAKAKAESTGEATYTESNSLRFTPVKL